ncbi:PIN domain-containing protein [Desulfosporosinus hippei]|uniref:PIN domain-containing protein n=1 Tax=Desulfosporosinus hippei DSM 8344 TaxID=1121419 RepID=A0A1G8H0A2_9FIRM|nr:PIN domain-containing protein [Desulfosporosinus hippei]SDI00034.1 hypothetical protein SAMN05443529_1246 [Desulfosporosinus hippei DSM 8344]
MDRVLFDTTILCGALLTRGINYKLLELAQVPTLFQPVITEVVVCEFIANCRRGMRGTIYSEKEIDQFFEGFSPLLNFENIERIQVGRQLWVDVTKSNQPIGHFLYHLFQLRTGQRKDALLTTLDNEGKQLKDIDPFDIHVMFGALEHDCNILLTSNVDDFPKVFGNVEVVRPRAYYEYLTNQIKID